MSRYVLDLTEKGRQHLDDYTYACDDQSLSTQYLTPFWDWVLSYVPADTAPNVLTLMSLITMITAFGIHLSFPSSQLASLLIAGLIFTYQTLDAIDGKHARNLNQATPLGEIFDHGCDAFICVILTYLAADLIQIPMGLTMWSLIQAGQLMFINTHLRALTQTQHAITFNRWLGSGEAILIITALFAWKAIYGQTLTLALGLSPMLITLIVTLAYLVIINQTLTIIAQYPRSATRHTLIYFLFAYVVHYLCLVRFQPSLTLVDIIGDGFTLTILIVEIILSKMTQQTIRPLVVGMITLIRIHSYLSLLVPPIYFALLLTDLSVYLNQPLLFSD